MKTSVRMISEITGYSPATVCNALNRKKGVNSDTAAKILSVAEQVGYSNDIRIKSIRFVWYTSSGLIAANTPFFASLLNGIEQEACNMKLTTIITHISNKEKDFKQRLQQILRDTSCGIIMLATELDNGDAHLFECAKAPLILLDNWLEGAEINSILISNTDSACKATEFLIQNGHRSIGYLKGNVRITNFYYREQGYLRALNRNGLIAEPEFTYSLSPDTISAWKEFKELLEQGCNLPTAFFADNDNIALGAMKAMLDCGIKIPEDVSIIGFDDMPSSEIAFPPLTTIRVPKEDMGRLAVRMLQDNKESNLTSVVKSQICTQLIIRDSVKNLKK